MNLTQKVVIITGASRGIGRAAVYKFVEAGCKVVLIARSEDKLAQVVADFDTNQVLSIPADVADLESCQQIVEKTRKQFDKIDILINNAAVGIYSPGEAIPLTDMHRAMQVNFFGPLQLMQACIPAMKTNGGGLIINVSSIVGRRATPWVGGYCASKAALEHLVEAMRVELAPHNIRFSTLYPGVTKTDFVDHALGTPHALRGRVKGVTPERVATKLVKIAKTEARDTYVTLFDWFFVNSTHILPGLADKVFQRYFKQA